MKNLILVLFALVVVMVATSFVYAHEMGDDYIEYGSINVIPVIDADQIPYGTRPINKLNRGIMNGVGFWTEIPAQVCKVSSETDPLTGMTFGLVQGAVTSVIRAGSAIFDTVTFMVPPYNKPVMVPEYAYLRADQKIKDYLW